MRWSAPNPAAEQAPEVTNIPPPPPSPTSPPPTVEVKVEAKAEPTATPTSTLTSASPLPDLVVLGPDTQYPVRARVIQGWGYEFVDLSAAYDIVVYRDVFGMLAHQIDDENVQRYRRQSRFARSGPIRIALVDAQPHPDAGCPGWGWAPDRDTFVDPYGMTQEPCRVEHSLFPQGDGAGTTLLIGWGYNAGTTLAIGAAGPYLADASTSASSPRRCPGPATSARRTGRISASRSTGRWARRTRRTAAGSGRMRLRRSCRRGGEMRACAGPCLLQRVCGVSRRLTFVAIDDFILRKPPAGGHDGLEQPDT